MGVWYWSCGIGVSVVGSSRCCSGVEGGRAETCTVEGDVVRVGVAIRVKAIRVLKLRTLGCEGHVAIRLCEVWEGHAGMVGATVVAVLGWGCYATMCEGLCYEQGWA